MSESNTPRTDARWKQEWELCARVKNSSPAHGMRDCCEELEGELFAMTAERGSALDHCTELEKAEAHAESLQAKVAELERERDEAGKELNKLAAVYGIEFEFGSLVNRIAALTQEAESLQSQLVAQNRPKHDESLVEIARRIFPSSFQYRGRLTPDQTRAVTAMREALAAQGDHS